MQDKNEYFLEKKAYIFLLKRFLESIKVLGLWGRYLKGKTAWSERERKKTSLREYWTRGEKSNASQEENGYGGIAS